MNGKIFLWSAAWLAAIALGMGALAAYSFTPGAQADAPPGWPAESGLRLSADKPTLVMVAHPHCSCSRASIAELARLMSRLGGQVAGYVVFVKPQGVAEDWERTDLWESVALIDGVALVGDPGGEVAAHFGAATSGQTYLYGSDGRLRFKGGITPTRSHQGDSVGRQRIISLVTEGKTDRSESAVYGCALEDAAGADFWLAAVRGAGLWD